MKSMLTLLSFLLVVTSTTSVKASVINIFSAPKTGNIEREVYYPDGFEITILRFQDFGPTGNFLGTNSTGFDNSVKLMRLERVNRGLFNLTEIGTGALYSGLGIEYASPSGFEVLFIPYSTLLLTYKRNGLVEQMGLSPWGESYVISEYGSGRSLSPLSVNLNGINWVEMTLLSNGENPDGCKEEFRSRISNASLSADIQAYCSGFYSPSVYIYADIFGQRNDAGFASIDTVKVSAVPIPGGLILLGSALMFFAGINFRSKNKIVS